jgi:putative oxygen-independent coproporphyrinogen III oxidase
VSSAQLLNAAANSADCWSADPGFGVYVHIPFCRHRCHYCDFNTYEGQDALHRPYVDALIAHVETWCEQTPGLPEATSVFFGGGTPTLLAPADLRRILRAVCASPGVAQGAEVTVEVNPETVDERVFFDLLEAGFNRVSIGVQSLAERVLIGLGRTHSARGALGAIEAARSAGFTNINADLIYGSPWESAADWLASVEGVVAARPEHISAYALTVEAGTPLATLVATGRAPGVDADVQAARHDVADSILAAAGYRRYEVSNWSVPGRECRHNLLYWSHGNYVGFGAGAHGHIDGRRWWAVRRPADFIERALSGAGTDAGHETLDTSARAGESLMLGLRLTGGIDERSWALKYGQGELDWRSDAIDRLIGLGLLERAGGSLRMAPAATLLGDEVARSLL